MKVLVTGKDGFIGKHLVSSLGGMDIISVGRSDIDLTNRAQVNALFELHTFDVVVHTAISGVIHKNIDDSSVIRNNLLMFYNILSNKHRFGKLIQLGSGAELDRFNGHPINEFSQLSCSYPVDNYGISKNIISKLCKLEQNCYTLRIFNVFGFGELPTRMMHNNISRYINKQEMVIAKNRLMDFFSIEDFISVCNLYIHNNGLPRDIDCCYSNKTTLCDIANIINKLDKHKVDINVQSPEMGLSYCGNSAALDQLPLSLQGLQQGMLDLHRALIPNN